MFTVAVIDDDIPVAPHDFREDYRAQIKLLIQRKYVDRVIPNVGLCIEFYDFVDFKDAIIYPGDGKFSCGEAYYRVEFRLIVFRPVVDEWLVGSITGSTERGITVSLGFFQDVEIPSSNLRTPYSFDPVQGVWVWQYCNPDTKEAVNFFYEKDELLRFRIISVSFPESKGPSPEGGKVKDGAGKESAKGSPMKILGAVDLDGLGCVSWWPDSMEDDEEQEPARSPMLAPIQDVAM
mmetsp:Transcript_47792/g.121208  ORF Transcript_47792/g.121208 Transcript_47792/m.121208 type:complete len:235 (+) Transcript_47792:65-769(+)